MTSATSSVKTPLGRWPPDDPARDCGSLPGRRIGGTAKWRDSRVLPLPSPPTVRSRLYEDPAGPVFGGVAPPRGVLRPKRWCCTARAFVFFTGEVRRPRGDGDGAGVEAPFRRCPPAMFARDLQSAVTSVTAARAEDSSTMPLPSAKAATSDCVARLLIARGMPLRLGRQGWPPAVGPHLGPLLRHARRLPRRRTATDVSHRARLR